MSFPVPNNNNPIMNVASAAGSTVNNTVSGVTNLVAAPLNLLDISVPDYLNSISGGKPDSHRFDNTILLMVAAVFAGYTATALPADFLKLFESPIVQFIVFYIIGITSYGGGMPPGGKGFGPFKVFWAGPYVFLDAILVVCIMQLAVFLLRKWYKEDEDDEDDED